ncbi:uncharacterized protein LOC144563174 [Carex rostrata]
MSQAMLPPGFRFHPTDEELILYYLKRKVMGKKFQFMPISEVELYKFAPWDLPEMSCLRTKDLEWFFFCPRDKKYPNGSRANRSTEIGFWKTTGKDRTIVHDSRVVGMKKSLVFHTGKPPKGDRTDWVMYEYRLSDDRLAASGVPQDAYVICKIFKKSGLGPKIAEQYGAPFNEEDWEDDADLEASVAAFPFLPSTVQPSNSNHAIATTSVADPVPVPVVGTAMVEFVPESTAPIAILEPASVSVATDAISTRRSVELPVAATGTATSDPDPFIMPQCCTAFPDSPEMDGIQVDELTRILLDSPYCPGNLSCQLAPQQPPPAEVNFSEAEAAVFNESNWISGEVAYPIGVVPTGSSLAPATEGPYQQYIELNDVLFGVSIDSFFPDCFNPASSPEMDIDAFFSNEPTMSDAGSTAD